jgi:hypothetical protein
MRTTLDIEDRLLREAKSVAAQHGTTLTAIIEQALRRLLEGNAGKPSGKKDRQTAAPSAGQAGQRSADRPRQQPTHRRIAG